MGETAVMASVCECDVAGDSFGSEVEAWPSDLANFGQLNPLENARENIYN